MLKLQRNIVITAVSLAFMGAGFSGVAAATGGGDSPSSSQTSTQDDDEKEGEEGREAEEPESPGDQARQDEACQAAGISPSATNIDYDDETGVCRLDSGEDEGGGDGGEDGAEAGGTE